MEDKELALNDKTTKVFINTTASLDDDNLNPKLVSLIRYINSETITDEYTKKLDEVVKIKRRSADWRVKYMKYELNLLESRKEGIEEGEKRLSTLIKILNKEKRYDDIDRVINDKEYKYKLYQQYNIQ